MKDNDRRTDARSDAVGTDLGAAPTPDLWMPAIPAEVDRLTQTRRLLVKWATSVGLSRDQVNDLTLAAYEAMSNVVDHAYPHAPGTFDLRAAHHDNRVTVTIVDYGRWKPATAAPSPVPALRGRGLALMKGLSAEFELVHKAVGTLVRMTWSRHAT